MLHRITQTEPVDLVRTLGWHVLVHLTVTTTLYSPHEDVIVQAHVISVHCLYDVLLMC